MEKQTKTNTPATTAEVIAEVNVLMSNAAKAAEKLDFLLANAAEALRGMAPTEAELTGISDRRIRHQFKLVVMSEVPRPLGVRGKKEGTPLGLQSWVKAIKAVEKDHARLEAEWAERDKDFKEAIGLSEPETKAGQASLTAKELAAIVKTSAATLRGMLPRIKDAVAKSALEAVIAKLESASK